MNTNSFARTAVAITAAALLSACAIKAPVYQPSIDNVEALKRVPSKVAVGTFKIQPGAEGASSISLRGSPMSSPVGSDYAAYLAEALKRELVLAGKFDAASRIEIGGVLLKNDIAAGGVSTNSGEMQVRFTVTREGQSRYDRTLSTTLTWDSSFVGAIAIPKAQESYPRIVQKLISTLLADADFQNAVK